jgi:radical SAM-linked protein
MKLSFGPALPVGTAGEREYADVWLTRYTDCSELLGRLAESAPVGLAPFEARYVSEKLPSLSAALTIGMYRVRLVGEEIEPEVVHAALERKLASGQLVVEHKGKTKVFDLARSVPKDARVEVVDGGVDVEFPVRMGPQGSLRPEALIRGALTESLVDVPVVRTTRLDLLVEDEEGQWSRPV